MIVTMIIMIMKIMIIMLRPDFLIRACPFFRFPPFSVRLFLLADFVSAAEGACHQDPIYQSSVLPLFPFETCPPFPCLAPHSPCPVC